jgi:hypothetical protein
MTGFAVWFAAVATGAPAAVPLPDLPVPLVRGDHGPCSTARIINLPRGDRLSVRSGPSREERALARLPSGREVYACTRRGDWFGIVFERRARRTGCNVLDHPRPAASVYIGPCRSGWVHERYLGGYADWVGP